MRRHSVCKVIRLECDQDESDQNGPRFKHKVRLTARELRNDNRHHANLNDIVRVREPGAN
jgi:hypothetical protein